MYIWLIMRRRRSSKRWKHSAKTKTRINNTVWRRQTNISKMTNHSEQCQKGWALSYVKGRNTTQQAMLANLRTDSAEPVEWLLPPLLALPPEGHRWRLLKGWLVPTSSSIIQAGIESSKAWWWGVVRSAPEKARRAESVNGNPVC